MKAGSIVEVFCKHNGNVADAWEQHLQAYEREFAELIASGKPLTLFEIGVENGGSLQVWRDYLPAASNVIGLDANPLCKDLQLGSRIEIFIGDPADPKILQQALGDKMPDIIIDDGSHKPRDVSARFDLLWPKLASGGLYIIEDACCSYWSSHGGGFRKGGTVIETFKGLADALNAEYIFPDDVHNSAEFSRLMNFHIELQKISFYDSMVVVQKKSRMKREAYKKIIGGTRAPVMDTAHQILELSCVDLQNTLLTIPAAHTIGRRAHELLAEERIRAAAFEKENKALQKSLDERFKEIAGLTKMLIENEKERAGLEQRTAATIDRLEKALRRVTGSLSWRLTLPLRVFLYGLRSVLGFGKKVSR